MKVEIQTITTSFTDVTTINDRYPKNIVSGYDIEYVLFINSFHRINGSIFIKNHSESFSMGDIEKQIIEEFKSAIQSNDSHNS